MRAQSKPAGSGSSRRSSEGRTSRICSSGTTENSSETSTPIPRPCAAASRVTPYSASASSGVESVEHEGHRRDRGARQRHAEQTSGEAKRHHLQHVDADDLPAAGADALEHRNAADLLVHEDPRDARHGDPAENHDHEADHAEIVLGALEVSADLVVGASIRSNIHELVREAVAQRSDQRLDAIFGQAHGRTRRIRLPKLMRPVAGRSAESMRTRGPRLNPPIRRPGSFRMTPRIANVPVR